MIPSTKQLLFWFVLWMLLPAAVLFGGCMQLPGKAGAVQARVEANIIDGAGSYCDRLTPAERGATCERFNAKLRAEKGATAVIVCPGDKFPLEGEECRKR